LLWVVQLAICAGAYLITNCGLKVDENSSGDVLASASLRKEGVEGIVTTSNRLVGGHLSVRLDAVFQAVQLPTCIAGLDASLTDVDGNNLETGKRII